MKVAWSWGLGAAVSALLAGGAVLMAWTKQWTKSTDAINGAQAVANHVTSPPSSVGTKPSRRPPGPTGTTDSIRSNVSEDSSRARILEDLTRRWLEASKQDTGQALLIKQLKLGDKALELGASSELLKFLTFLKQSGANDVREHILTLAGGRFFEGVGAEDSRRWLLTLEDGPMKQKLCDHAGRHFTGDGLKAFIDSLHPDGLSQSAALTGYCRTMAKTDPSGAVKTFMDIKPPAVNFAGITGVMAALPPSADFAAISSTLPDDSKSIARSARSALLQSWAAARPEEAAQYVISNSILAKPEQMAVVVEKWAGTTPDKATAWIEALSPGKPRDEGMAAMAQHWTSAREPAKAWQYAGQIGDFDKRVATATVVFKEWEKTDEAAATAAWVKLFPGAVR